MRLLFCLVLTTATISCTSLGSQDTIYVSPSDYSQLGLNKKNAYASSGSYTGTSSSIGGVDLYDCADFSSSAEAQRAFVRLGGPSSDPSDLDRDGDGFACEFDPTSYRTTRTYQTPYKSNSNCHWVDGYRRKDGTYVRGHQRCR
ncbi:MAG: excalibur calcium-binding domain-containing protein [Pseudomonadota bacterium]